MRPFLVDPEHINVLVWAAHCYSGQRFTWHYGTPTHTGLLTPQGFDQAGQMLVDANVETVNTWRQPDAEPSVADRYRYSEPRRTGWSIIELLNAVDCYLRQSCELTSGHTSQAQAFCRALQDVLVRAVPNRDAGPWSITAHSVPQRSA